MQPQYVVAQPGQQVVYQQQPQMVMMQPGQPQMVVMQQPGVQMQQQQVQYQQAPQQVMQQQPVVQQQQQQYAPPPPTQPRSYAYNAGGIKDFYANGDAETKKKGMGCCATCCCVLIVIIALTGAAAAALFGRCSMTDKMDIADATLSEYSFALGAAADSEIVVHNGWGNDDVVSGAAGTTETTMDVYHKAANAKDIDPSRIPDPVAANNTLMLEAIGTDNGRSATDVGKDTLHCRKANTVTTVAADFAGAFELNHWGFPTDKVTIDTTDVFSSAHVVHGIAQLTLTNLAGVAGPVTIGDGTTTGTISFNGTTSGESVEINHIGRTYVNTGAVVRASGAIDFHNTVGNTWVVDDSTVIGDTIHLSSTGGRLNVYGTLESTSGDAIVLSTEVGNIDFNGGGLRWDGSSSVGVLEITTKGGDINFYHGSIGQGMCVYIEMSSQKKIELTVNYDHAQDYEATKGEGETTVAHVACLNCLYSDVDAAVAGGDCFVLDLNVLNEGTGQALGSVSVTVGQEAATAAPAEEEEGEDAGN